MKACPLCPRTYPDDLRFCLDDGQVLVACQDDDATWVSPEPAPPDPTIPGPVPPWPLPPRPVPPGPTLVPPAPRFRPRWIAIGALAVIIVVLLFGGLKLVLWSVDREDHTAAQGNNSAPPSFNVNPSPGPTPSPTATPHPSPSPSPSPTVVEPTEKPLSTGTYQCEFSQLLNEGGIQTTRTLKYQFTFNGDGTYTAQGYASIPLTGMSDRLYREEKGSYTQVGDLLTLRDRLERTFDFGADSWRPWVVASGGGVNYNKIRSVTSTTFQLRMNSEQRWLAFSRL